MQVLNPSSPVTGIYYAHDVNLMYILENRSLPFLAQGQDEENPWWLELLRPYIALRDFYICSGLAPRIVSTLQDLVDERVTNALPVLQNIHVQNLRESPESVQEAIRQLVTARRHSGHPVIVHDWEPTFVVSGTYMPIIQNLFRNLTLLP